MNALLTALGTCLGLAGIVAIAAPYRTSEHILGPADIVSGLQSFYGIRQMSSGYDVPVVWIRTEGEWRPMKADELASLPYRTEGYPCVPINQVAAQNYFQEFGSWKKELTSEEIKGQYMNLCENQRKMGFATVPCEDLEPKP